LGALAARLESKAVECGFERDDRRWSGHLTIGRLRGAKLTAKTYQILHEANARDFGISQVESISLYRSHLGAADARYEALATLLFHRPGQPR
jgi:RNA 2',3'-cyclic 3'-phosphodiesterase